MSFRLLKFLLLTSFLIVTSQSSFANPRRVASIKESIESLMGIRVRLVVLDSKKIDAYVHPMGYIVLTNGLLEHFGSNSEIAFILAHEMAHLIREHYKDVEEVMGLSKGSYDLEKEIEADRYAVLYMEALHYQPGTSIKVLEGLLTLKSGNSSQIEKRIKALRTWILQEGIP